MQEVYLVCSNNLGYQVTRTTNFLIGEDALANVSVEQDGEEGPITGFVRIRSRSQGLALSLGNLKGLNKA